MGIETYVNFKRLTFREVERTLYQYSLVGGSEQHSCLPTIIDGKEYGVRTHYDKITPRRSKSVWQKLLREDALEMPQSCGVCPGDAQIILWRVFTDASLEMFKQNQGIGRTLELNPEDAKVDYGGNLVYEKKKDDLEKPGYLWMARVPDLALGVGLSRAILAHEPISLLGINVCKCDLDSGFELYTTITNHDRAFVFPINPGKLRYNMMGEGDIVTQIPQGKIISGVAYEIDLSYFDYIKNAADGITPSFKNLRHVSGFVGEVLCEIAVEDPAIEHPLKFNLLPKTWRPFLRRIHNNIFYQ